MPADFWFVIGLLFGLAIGLAINAKGRQDRDDEIKRLQKRLNDKEL